MLKFVRKASHVPFSRDDSLLSGQGGGQLRRKSISTMQRAVSVASRGSTEIAPKRANQYELSLIKQQERQLVDLINKQPGRMDDQRGTAVSFGLPEFLLANEENPPAANGRRTVARPPPLYASSVRSDATTPTESELKANWQADYV